MIDLFLMDWVLMLNDKLGHLHKSSCMVNCPVGSDSVHFVVDSYTNVARQVKSQHKQTWWSFSIQDSLTCFIYMVCLLFTANMVNVSWFDWTLWLIYSKIIEGLLRKIKVMEKTVNYFCKQNKFAFLVNQWCTKVNANEAFGNALTYRIAIALQCSLCNRSIWAKKRVLLPV